MATPYAEVRWSAGDIETLLAERDVEWTDDQIADFMADHERQVQDRLVELGWEVWRTLLDTALDTDAS